METMTNSPKDTDALGDSPDMWGTTELISAETPERGGWFRESRYAMFIHWGLYSEAAGCWDGKVYHGIAEWLMRNAQIPVADYEKLASSFNPVDFDARAVVRLAKESGMKYIVITAKHHDGFAMFKSQVSKFNIVDATPFGRDPIAELAEACREGGLKLGFYYSQFQDWHEPDAGGNEWDFPQPMAARDFNRYLSEKALPQIRELLSNYGPIGLIWFDTPGTISSDASKALFDFVHELQPECLVNSRIGNGFGDYATLGDQEVPLTAPEGLWETIDTHNDTWGYALHDHNWKSARELISRLTRLVSLGGNYMLNVGPTGKGIIPEASASILREVGAWLQRNGESVYGTKRSPVGLQAWGCSTLRGDKLYLHILHWPQNQEILVPGLASCAAGARFLATGQALRLGVSGECLQLKLPAQAPDHPVTTIEVTLIGAPETIAPASQLHPGLVNELGAPFATLTSCSCVKRSWMEKFGDWHHTEGIGDWVGGSEARWSFMALSSGVYDIHAHYECWGEADYSDLEMSIAGQTWIFPAIYTGGGKALRTRLRAVRIGRVGIPAGPVELILRGLSIKGENALFLQKITLAPAQ